MKNFAEKHRPKSLKEFGSHGIGISELRDLVYRKKPVILHGPTGTGKTSAVYALAKDLDYDVIEINASDERNKDRIHEVVGNAINQRSLFGRGRIVLVDEVDGISGNADRGGVAELCRVITNAPQAIVFTANDAFIQKLSPLRQKCKLINFDNLNYLSIASIIKNIAALEKIGISEDDAKMIARRSGGDIRAAINDLESLSYGKIGKKEIESLGEREKKDSIFNVLKLIFKSTNAENVLRSLDKVDMDMDEAILWIEENIPIEYDGHDLYNAYESLAKADVFRGRIMRWQHWRFLVYINDLLTAGIALAKKEKNPEITQYKRSTRILKIWMMNQKYAKRKAIAQDLSKQLHTSSKRIIRDVMPYLKIIYKKQPLNLKLDEEQIEWLRS
ncbi:MAG TPA: replication factor C large subunit [Candidatus Nanoarchaeia archaeon]|nr:replication factor C large subunit [Candidatus Nanoarchaeia archaeon]